MNSWFPQFATEVHLLPCAVFKANRSGRSDSLRTFVMNYDGKFDKLDRLRQQVENGTLSLRLAATYPKEQASAAHKRLEAGGTRGRLVIEF